MSATSVFECAEIAEAMILGEELGVFDVLRGRATRAQPSRRRSLASENFRRHVL